MDKTREARRSATTTMTASNGVTKRRQRISGLENSSGQMHHEVVTVRDRPEKKERDPESLNRSTRRRRERFSLRSERDFGDEDSSDESHGDYRRKSFPSSRIPRHASAAASLKVADEMIGVPVPRKARSACLKRSHDCRTSSGSGGVGFGEDRRRTPASPGSYCFEVASPSSSTVSVKHNKNVNGSKSRIPKPRKSSATIVDDLEIEIAEVLSGLKKQPPSISKGDDDSENSLKSSEVKENGGLISCKARIETGQSGNIDQSTENPEKSVRFIPETTKASSVVSDIQMEKEVSEEQKLNSQNFSVSKRVLENNKDEESNCSSKLDIDLMVPPTMPSSLLPLVTDPLVSDPTVSKDYCKQESSIKPEEVKHTKAEKREWLNLDLERPSQETARDSIPRLQNFDWSYQPHEDKSAQQSSALDGWPSGLLLNGYGPLIKKTDKPVDVNNASSTQMQVAPFSTSQPKPKRCATHLLIARNIQLHQHFLKTNHSSQQNKASSIYPKSSDDSKPATGNSPSSPILSLNTQAQDRIIAVNQESGHFALTRTKKQPQPPPSPASTSIVPAPTFIFPANHHLKPRRSASVNFSHHHHSNSSPTEASSSSSPSPYFTIIPNNAYTFQRGGGTPSQEMPFYNGSLSFYSPQMFHRQPQQKQNQSSSQRDTKPPSSCPSSSSHRQPPQPQVSANSNLPSQKHRQQQSQKSETKAAAGDNNSYSQIMTGPVQPQNFSMSFTGSPPANLSFSSSNGYHIVHHKSHDSKSGGSNNGDEHSKKTLPGMMMNGQTLVFDNPPRTLNFVSGTWPPPATINDDPSLFAQRQQSTRTTHDSIPATSSSQWKYHPVTSSASLTSCNSLNLNKQHIIRTHGGETHISFAAPSKVRSKLTTNKALPLSPVPSTAQPQDHQTGNSATGSTQKTSPVCGRTVPPIITSHPGHQLSELKY